MAQRGSRADWSARIGAPAAQLRNQYQALNRVHLVWVIPASVFGLLRLLFAIPVVFVVWIPILGICFAISMVALIWSFQTSKRMVNTASSALTEANTPRSITIGPAHLSTTQAFDGWAAEHSIKWATGQHEDAAHNA
jgi:hypothetical protein